MVFWPRIRYCKIETLTNQCKRHYHNYSSTHGVVTPPNPIVGFAKSRVLNRNRLTDQNELHRVLRFFAAPVMANKPKPESNVEKRTRLNDEIKADIVRLVIDDGHIVVSRREALNRAKELDLDLVEVDKSAKPPVCKIMDYNREKYKKQLKEKERSKIKAEGTLRNGPPKEIRFTKKTEQKDLQTKASTVKRLMEKGYRVKCMATGTEEEDMGGMLARLSALIEDVAVVESGPMVEKKQAYAVVRHIRFGLKKKKGSSKKTSDASTSKPVTLSSEPTQDPQETEEESGNEQSEDEESEDEKSCDDESYSESENNIDPGQMELPHRDRGNNRTTWSTLDANDDFKNIFDFDEKKAVASEPRSNNSKLPFTAKGPTQVGENRYSGPGAINTVPRGPTQVGGNRYGGPGATNTVPRGPTHEVDNRYGVPGATTTVPQGPANGGGNRYGGPGATNTVPRGPVQGADNRYGGPGATTTVPQGPASGGGNRYGGPGATNTVPRGPIQGGEIRYGGPGGESTVPRGPIQGGENRYSGPGGANTVPRGPIQGGENRYGGPGGANTVRRGPIQGGENRYGGPGGANTVTGGPTQVGEIRYRGQSEVSGRFQPTDSLERTIDNAKLSEPSPFQTSQDNRGLGATNSVHRGFQPSYRRQQSQEDANGSLSTDHNPLRADSTPSGKMRPTDVAPKREQSHPDAPGSQRSSYGIFSTPK